MVLVLLRDFLIQSLQEGRPMDKGKTSQGVDIVEILFNQETDFPWVRQMARGQPRNCQFDGWIAGQASEMIPVQR